MAINCFYPWTSFYMGETTNNNSKICCRDIIRHNVPFNDNIMKWRNDKSYVEFREAMLNNTVHDIFCKKECPILISKDQTDFIFDTIINGSNIFNNDENALLIQKEIQNKEVILKSYPMFCHISTDHICNFNCTMCHVKHDSSYFIDNNSIQFISKILKETNGNLSITVSGGEPFYSHYTLDIFEELSAYRNSWFKVITNGSYFHDKLLNSMQLENIAISVDAPFKTLFEKIRPGSDFEKIETNIKKYISLSKQRNFPVNIVMTISYVNYKYIVEMFDYVNSLSDNVCFEIYPIIEKENDYFNIFEKCALSKDVEDSFDYELNKAINIISKSNYIYKQKLLNQINGLLYRKNDIKDYYIKLNAGIYSTK